MATEVVEIRRIGARDALALRDAVLRLGLPPGGSVYRHDDAPDTLHLGAFANRTLVAIATVCREAIPDAQTTDDAGAWRLRGMATLAPYRGCELGKDLAQRCIAYALAQGGTLVWCTARLTTVSFYRRLGFEECSSPFPLPQFSNQRYVRMRRPLP